MSGMPFLFADFISFFRFTVFVFSILPSIVRNWFMTSCRNRPHKFGKAYKLFIKSFKSFLK